VIEQQTTLGVYFIDQYNFRSLYDRANQGDPLACDLARALMNFMDQAPQPICSICNQHVLASKIPDMTIVVMRTNNTTLTTWICEECATCDDLDSHIEKIIRDWPAIPKDAIIEILKKHTLH
jgi:hypothetical protein